MLKPILAPCGDLLGTFANLSLRPTILAKQEISSTTQCHITSYVNTDTMGQRYLLLLISPKMDLSPFDSTRTHQSFLDVSSHLVPQPVSKHVNLCTDAAFVQRLLPSHLQGHAPSDASMRVYNRAQVEPTAPPQPNGLPSCLPPLYPVAIASRQQTERANDCSGGTSSTVVWGSLRFHLSSRAICFNHPVDLIQSSTKLS